MGVEETRQRRQMVTDRELSVTVYRLTPAGTSEVAELVGISRQATNERLERLEERGWIWSKKVGPTRVWMHTTVMSEPGVPAPDEPAATPDAEDPEKHPTAGARSNAAEQQGKTEELVNVLREQRHRERDRKAEKSRAYREQHKRGHTWRF